MPQACPGLRRRRRSESPRALLGQRDESLRWSLFAPDALFPNDLAELLVFPVDERREFLRLKISGSMPPWPEFCLGRATTVGKHLGANRASTSAGTRPARTAPFQARFVAWNRFRYRGKSGRCMSVRPVMARAASFAGSHLASCAARDCRGHLAAICVMSAAPPP